MLWLWNMRTQILVPWQVCMKSDIYFDLNSWGSMKANNVSSNHFKCPPPPSTKVVEYGYTTGARNDEYSRGWYSLYSVWRLGIMDSNSGDERHGWSVQWETFCEWRKCMMNGNTRCIIFVAPSGPQKCSKVNKDQRYTWEVAQNVEPKNCASLASMPKTMYFLHRSVCCF